MKKLRGTYTNYLKIEILIKKCKHIVNTRCGFIYPNFGPDVHLMLKLEFIKNSKISP